MIRIRPIYTALANRTLGSDRTAPDPLDPTDPQFTVTFLQQRMHMCT